MRRILLALIALACLWAPAAASANPFGSPGSLADGVGAGLGQSVSISADGTVAVVGEPNYNGGAGAAMVYANSDGNWTFVQRLTPAGEVGAGHFGAAVSMDNGGTTLIVGAPDDNAGLGAAWAFALSDGTWTEQAELLAGAAEVDAGRFGASVAVAGGGTIALIGAPMSDAGRGQVYTFYWGVGDGWYRFQRMSRTGVTAGARFGASVALSNNGSNGLVGAPGVASGDGAAYPFSHFGLESPYWIDGTAIASPATGGNFGAAVAMSRGGEYDIVGAPLAGSGDEGAAYQYRPSGTREATFADPSPTSGGHFGASVAFAGDTLDQLVVGAPGDRSGAGAAYDFDSSNGQDWLSDGAAIEPVSAPASGDAYGTSVAVTADGSNALVGAPGSDGFFVHFISALITVPDVPVSAQAVAGTESAGVSWGAPFSSGGSPITGYTVTSSPGGFTCQTGPNAFGCTVSGLTGGQSYTFTVTAENSRGSSAPSSPTGPVTPASVQSGGGGDHSGDPDRSAPPADPPRTVTPAGDTTPPSKSPGAFKITRRASSITLSWGAAKDDTGVAGYRIYQYARGAWTQVATKSASARSITVKVRSKTRFQVRAFDAAGNLSAPLVSGWLAPKPVKRRA
jgi:Fibronectin type III domain/FG-GAP repeat